MGATPLRSQPFHPHLAALRIRALTRVIHSSTRVILTQPVLTLRPLMETILPRLVKTTRSRPPVQACARRNVSPLKRQPRHPPPQRQQNQLVPLLPSQPFRPLPRSKKPIVQQVS